MKNISTRRLIILFLFWALCIFVEFHLESLLLFWLFLLVPVALSLVPTIKRSGYSSNYHAFLQNYHFYFAASIGIALLFPQGSMVSGILSIPWAIYSFALFGYGIRRFMERGWYRIEENAIDISFLFLFLSGIALCIYSFSTESLFASHFLNVAIYFALAAFPTMFIGWLGRPLPIEQKVKRTYRWSVGGMMVSPLIIGIGTLLTNVWAQNIGLWIYTLCTIFYCFYVFTHMEKRSSLARILIPISASIFVVTTVLSVVYGVFQLQGYIWIKPEEWLWYQEIPIAVGVLLGMIGWYRYQPIEKNGLYQMPQTSIIGGSYIGKDFLQQNGYEAEIVSHAGIIMDMKKFKRNDLIIELLHPKVVSWLENTSLYDITLEAHWAKSAWLFEKCHKAFSNKIQQANIPSPCDGRVELDSKIISVINHEQYWNRDLNAWICSYKHTGETYITGIYTEHKQDDERYIHFTMPIPGCNRTTFYRLEHGSDGSLQITSVPRRGGMSDEGHYIMTKNFSFRFPFNENLIIWVDEYGRLRMTHRFWFMGAKVVTLEYEIFAK